MIVAAKHLLKEDTCMKTWQLCVPLRFLNMLPYRVYNSAEQTMTLLIYSKNHNGPTYA